MTGKGFYGCEADGKFIDIGTPESYAQAEKFFVGKPVSV
jgi:NDP-sugar pyrophosphorylase family protein